jgi:hypothetical protein
MRGLVPPDPETSVSDLRFAVIYTPRLDRKRFPAGNVEIHETADAARAALAPASNRHPAIVVGPSKSSEGQFIFYLQRWL